MEDSDALPDDPKGPVLIKRARENAPWVVAILSLGLNFYQVRVASSDANNRIKSEEQLEKYKITFPARTKCYAAVLTATFDYVTAAGTLSITSGDAKVAHADDIWESRERLSLVMTEADPLFDAEGRDWARKKIGSLQPLIEQLQHASDAGDKAKMESLRPKALDFGREMAQELYEHLFKEPYLPPPSMPSPAPPKPNQTR